MHLQVPKDMPCIVMGHEFLDALPVHVFRHDEQRGWLEVLVDEEPNTDDHRVRATAPLRYACRTPQVPSMLQVHV